MAYPDRCDQFGGECVACHCCTKEEGTGCANCREEYTPQSGDGGLCRACRSEVEMGVWAVLSSLSEPQAQYIVDDWLEGMSWKALVMMHGN